MSRSLLILVSLLVTLLPAAPRVVFAEETTPCASSKAAAEVYSCCICHELKSVLTKADVGLEFEILEMGQGVVVRMDGIGEAGRDAAAQLTSLLWMPGEANAKANYCPHCAARRQGLLKVDREVASTKSGMLVVLRTSDDATLAWLHEDARKQRSFLSGVLAGR